MAEPEFGEPRHRRYSRSDIAAGAVPGGHLMDCQFRVTQEMARRAMERLPIDKEKRMGVSTCYYPGARDTILYYVAPAALIARSESPVRALEGLFLVGPEDPIWQDEQDLMAAFQEWGGATPEMLYDHHLGVLYYPIGDAGTAHERRTE